MGAVVLDSPIDNSRLSEISKYAQVSNLVQVRSQTFYLSHGN